MTAAIPWERKEIFPKTILVPMLRIMARPMVSRNNTGSNQEVVVIASTAKITTTPATMIIGISREILSSRVLFSMAGPL